MQSSLTPPRDSEDLGVSGTVAVPIPTLRGSIAAEPQDRFALKDAREYTIQAVAYAPIFAFPSDVTIRIAEEGAQTFIDMHPPRATSTGTSGRTGGSSLPS